MALSCKPCDGKALNGWRWEEQKACQGELYPKFGSIRVILWVIAAEGRRNTGQAAMTAGHYLPCGVPNRIQNWGPAVGAMLAQELRFNFVLERHAYQRRETNMIPTMPNQPPGSASPMRGLRGNVRCVSVIGEGAPVPGADGPTSGTGASFLATLATTLGTGVGRAPSDGVGAERPGGGPGLEPAAPTPEMPAAVTPPDAPDFTHGLASAIEPGPGADEKPRASASARKAHAGSGTIDEGPGISQMSSRDAVAGQQPEAQSVALALILRSAGSEMTKCRPGGGSNSAEIPSVGPSGPITPADLVAVQGAAEPSLAPVVLHAPATQQVNPFEAARATVSPSNVGGRPRADPLTDMNALKSDLSPAVTTPDTGSTLATGAMTISAPVARPLEMAQAPALPQGSMPAPIYPQIAPALVSLAGGSAATQRLTVRLDPVELGLVEIRIERTENAPPEVSITADRPETLLLLQRDHRQLQKALDQAGIPAEGRLVTFQSGAVHPGGMGSNPDGQTASGQVYAGQSITGPPFDPGSDPDGSGRGRFRQDDGQTKPGAVGMDDNADDGRSVVAGPMMNRSLWLRAGVNIIA